MTRSDIEIAKAKLHLMSDHEKEELIYKLCRKIDSAYIIVFELEKDAHFKEVGAYLRKALEG